MKRRQSRWKPGMVYAVPLADGSFGIAQAGEAMAVNIIYVALFRDRVVTVPEGPPPLVASSALSLAATWRQALNRGEWLSIGQAAEVFQKKHFPNERFASSGYVGAKHYDAGILSGFLSACHGLAPWNIMKDERYYDAILRPGLPRPASAVVLGPSERAEYRKREFGLDA